MTFDYLLINPTDESISFDVICVYPNDLDDELFSYEYIEPMIVDTVFNTDDENFPVNYDYCSRFTLTIEPQSESVIHISLPTWPTGDRTKSERNLMYVVTLDVASFNDIEAYITYDGDRKLLHSNHTIDFISINLTEDENNVNLFVENIM